MDPYIHTIIATILLAISFYVGRYYGKEAGALQVWGDLLDAFDAKQIELNEEGTLTVTYHDDTTETIN